MRSCSWTASPVLRQPKEFSTSLEFSFCSLQKSVHYLLSSDAQGLFLIHAEEEDIAAAENWLATGNTPCFVKASLCPYAIADIALMHLKQLNGSLLTSSLYPYFMIVAENSNIDTQLYVMRMLVDRLPMAHYKLLKDMAFLWFKQSSFGNDWVHILKLGSLLGPLFVKKKGCFAVLCRHLTIVEAATRFVTLLVKQWTYFFHTGLPSSTTSERQDDTSTNQIVRFKGTTWKLCLFHGWIRRFVFSISNLSATSSFSNRGHAKGFKLDALLKLMDVKGSNRHTTLLHFVVVELIKMDEQFLYLPDELNGIKPASCLKLESIIASINDLDRGLDLTKEEVEFAQTDLRNVSALRSKFLDSVLPFYEDCSVHVLELKELLNVTLSKLKDVSEYFGESCDDQPSRQMDLFQTMYQFLNMFDHVSKEIQEKRIHAKVEQRNDKAHVLRKIRNCDDKKAATSFPCNAKESDDNRVKVSVSENSSHLNKSSGWPGLENLSKLENDGHKEIQKPIACVEEIEATTTKALLARLPLKANVHNAPHSLGYDSDWSTG